MDTGDIVSTHSWLRYTFQRDKTGNYLFLPCYRMLLADNLCSPMMMQVHRSLCRKFVLLFHHLYIGSLLCNLCMSLRCDPTFLLRS